MGQFGKLLSTAFRQTHERLFFQCLKGKPHLGQLFIRRLIFFQQVVVFVLEIRIDADIDVGLHIEVIPKDFCAYGLPCPNGAARNKSALPLNSDMVPCAHHRVKHDIVDENIAPCRDVCILNEGNAHILARMDLPNVHAADAAVYDDVAPLDLRTADHALDLNIARCLDGEAALDVTAYLHTAGKVNIARAHIDTAVDDKMWVDTDLLPVIDDLPIDDGDQLVVVDHLGILSLWKIDWLSGSRRDLLAEYILPRDALCLRDTDDKDITDCRPKKDVHVLVVDAVKGSLCGTPLDAHVEFLFEPCIFACDWCCPARRHKGGETRNAAPNRCAVNAVDDLLLLQRIQYIRDRRRQISLLIVEAYRCRHRIVRNLDGKGDGEVILPILSGSVKFFLNPLRRTHEMRELEDIVVRNARRLDLLTQSGQVNDVRIRLLRINGKVGAILTQGKLKALFSSPNDTFHKSHSRSFIIALRLQRFSSGRCAG